MTFLAASMVSASDIPIATRRVWMRRVIFEGPIAATNPASGTPAEHPIMQCMIPQAWPVDIHGSSWNPTMIC